jgi:hypothetical protein
MTGFPRERASGLGDGGPVSGSSPPSAFSESVEHAREHEARLSADLEPTAPARVDPYAEEHAAPRWQEVADAVWLAAYWSRHGRPARAGRHPGPAASDLPAESGPAQHTDEDVRHPEPPQADQAVAERPAVPSVADVLPLVPPTLPDLTGFAVPGPAGPRNPPLDAVPAPNGGAHGGPSAAARLLPRPEGPYALHVGRPLLPADDRPAQGPGRATALLARALHRLARRIPSRGTLELDEETTAEQGVVDGMWLPFLRPARTAAFDLVVLIDDAPTMRIWEDAAARLAEAAEHSGAFRGVRTVRVAVPRTGTATLRRTAGRRRPRGAPRRAR